jgi:chaperonin GroEL
MIVKEVFLKDEGQAKLRSGIKKIAGAVKSTLGPSGQTVLLESENHTRGLTVTKDGVTIARSINLFDPIENLAVQLMKQAADQTAVAAGDGTSTSIVLTEAIIDAFQELDFNKLNKTEVIRGVNAITDDIVKLLDSMSRKVSKRTLVDVATISANNDKELGKLIADTFKKVDLVTVENSANASTYNEIISGMRIDRGWTSKYFVNNEKTEECVFENPYILLTDIEINNLTLLEETLAHVIREQKPLLIIGNLSPNALNTLNMNVARKVIKACHIIPPSFGYRQKDLMFDLSVALGAKYISESIGDNLYTLTPLDLGQAAKVIVSKESTIIMRNDNTDEAVEKHLADLKSMESESMDATDKKFLNERIASISKGVGIIYVGGNSDIEQKEKYDRVDDAVRAVAAAVEDGILPGGGIALANCADEISHRYTDRTENFMAAVSILTNALIVPFTQIMLNAGEDPKAIGQTILEKHDLFFGYDAKNRVFGDLMKLGVVDPTKVTKSALINAVSVATTIVSTEAIVTNMRDESSK